MKSNLIVFLMCVTPLAVFAQGNSETTYGSCSPNMSNNSGNVTIVCKGLDPAIANEVADVVKQISILNKATATVKNQQLMLKTLNEIKATLQNAKVGPVVEVNAPIVQSSTADCSPNIVGNNNSNTCALKPVVIGPAEAASITATLKSLHAPGGKVRIDFELNAVGARGSALQLRDALSAAGFTVELGPGAIIFMGACGSQEFYPGLSFDCVANPNDPIPHYIGTALIEAGVLKAPIMGTPKGNAEFTFGIIIRKQ
jgi:hypothetical protein